MQTTRRVSKTASIFLYIYFTYITAVKGIIKCIKESQKYRSMTLSLRRACGIRNPNRSASIYDTLRMTKQKREFGLVPFIGDFD